ncbi:MAG: PepSY domain-containing protein, partial [Brevibacterium sp.]
IAIAAMVVWGYVMWWQRRPKHDPSKRFGVRPTRGAILNAPWWGIGATVLAALGIGVLLPMVGISLVVFLIIDVALGAPARRRERATG